jgi:hypothetical protein
MKINVSDAMKRKLQTRLAGTGDPDLKEFLDRLQPPQQVKQLTADEVDAVLGAVHLRLKDVTRVVSADAGRAPGELTKEMDALNTAVPKLEFLHARQTEREEGGPADA